jgi:hypothetical protein
MMKMASLVAVNEMLSNMTQNFLPGLVQSRRIAFVKSLLYGSHGILLKPERLRIQTLHLRPVHLSLLYVFFLVCWSVYLMRI